MKTPDLKEIVMVVIWSPAHGSEGGFMSCT